MPSLSSWLRYAVRRLSSEVLVRVLFTFAGGAGHFIPLLPTARAMEAAGHGVAFGCQSVLLPTAQQAGFDVFDTGGTTFRDASKRSPIPKLDGDRAERAVREGNADRIARSTASAIIARAAEWPSHLLVCDEMDFGCVVAAERLSIPHATMLVITSG